MPNWFVNNICHVIKKQDLITRLDIYGILHKLSYIINCYGMSLQILLNEPRLASFITSPEQVSYKFLLK